MLLSQSIHSSGARLSGGSTHGEPPMAILLMIFMTTQKPSNSGSMWRLHWPSCRTFPKLEQQHITHHQCACFLEDPSAKCLSGAIGAVYESHYIQSTKGAALSTTPYISFLVLHVLWKKIPVGGCVLDCLCDHPYLKLVSLLFAVLLSLHLLMFFITCVMVLSLTCPTWCNCSNQ